ncbi:MAG: universal stress protein [Candidatus Aminicenantes bacterium]|nr:universal stress protein [Candidatus Aminicenantes bacterium]
MFKTIVLATDLSRASDALLECAVGLKALGVQKVLLTHALGIRHLVETKYLLAPKVEPLLLNQKSRLEAQGLDVAIELAPGIPVEEIHRVAQENDASLIVIGSHGESMAEHALFKFGGTVSEVLHSFTRPLLLVRTRVVKNAGETCVEVSCSDFLKNILYCTDFSDTAERAFGYVEQLVENGGRSVTIMHVQDKTKIDKHLSHKLKEFNRIDAERIDRLKERLVKKGASRVETRIPYGIPTHEILGEAAAGDYSLIVMGSQGRGFIREIYLGSVSHNIARNAGVSLLLIPAIR